MSTNPSTYTDPDLAIALQTQIEELNGIIVTIYKRKRPGYKAEINLCEESIADLKAKMPALRIDPILGIQAIQEHIDEQITIAANMRKELTEKLTSMTLGNIMESYNHVLPLLMAEEYSHLAMLLRTNFDTKVSNGSPADMNTMIETYTEWRASIQEEVNRFVSYGISTSDKAKELAQRVALEAMANVLRLSGYKGISGALWIITAWMEQHK